MLIAADELKALLAAQRAAEAAARANPRVMKAIRQLVAEGVAPETARRLVAAARNEKE